jgi:D-sedoheptulose 7-phosphate isomerase
MKDYVKSYLQKQNEMLGKLSIEKVNEIIGIFKSTLDDNKQVFVFGNGGSAENSSHFITDLGKGASDKTYRRFRCHSLNANVGWMTAIGNDYSYDEIFVRQLMNLAQPGDLIVVMSVSGNSPNLVKAVEWSKQNNVRSIAMVGGKKGKLAAIADTVLVVDDEHYGRVEDAHMTTCHMIAYSFMEVESLQKPG